MISQPVKDLSPTAMGPKGPQQAVNLVGNAENHISKTIHKFFVNYLETNVYAVMHHGYFEGLTTLSSVLHLVLHIS